VSALAMAASAALASCGVTELYVGFLRLDGGTGGADGGTSTTSATGGTGGGSPCTPGATQSCYDGPGGTEGVGLCKAGSQACASDGASWEPCTGEVLPQVEDCASGLDQDCDGQVSPCGGTLLWAKRFGDGSDQHAQRLAVDAAGNVFVAGRFAGGIDFGGGTLTSKSAYDVFLAKLDGDGGHLWSKSFDTNLGTIQAIAVDSAGGIVVAGFFYGTVDFGGGPFASAGGQDIFVARFDGGGAHMWSKRFGDGSAQAATGIAMDSAGDILLAGRFLGALDLGGGPLTSAGGADVFVAKLDGTGGHVWSRSFGDAADQGATAIAADAAGGAVVVGDFSGSLNFGGGSLTSSGGDDIFVVKLDSSGGHAWSRSFGDAVDQHGRSVAVDGAGGVLIGGDFAGAVDFGGGAMTCVGTDDVFVAKLDGGDGGYRWARHFGEGGSDQIAAALAVDKASRVVAAGYFSGQVDFGGGALASAGSDDVFVASLDGDHGEHRWSRRFGAASVDQGRAVAVDGGNNVFLAGDFAASVFFGSTMLTSMGGSDVFVAKLAP